jgi:hypothetical protein
MSKTSSTSSTLKLLITAFLVIITITAISFSVFYFCLKAENHTHYVGIKNIASEKIAKTAWGMEMNAKNVFDEVANHLESPDDVIKALESKANLNPEVRGYFAAFVPNYFPQKGTWFEPYVHQNDSLGEFEMTQVGSAHHDYTKSNWYIHAKGSHESFWSEPYYYYDGTNISGHYTTYVKPIYNSRWQLVCVCGADMTFEWLTKDLEQIDAKIKEDKQLNTYSLSKSQDFYTVVLNNDGSCIAHPEGKNLKVTDKRFLTDLEQKKSGVIDMDVNGEACTVYYGSIEHVGWSLAVVVPQHDIWEVLQLAGLGHLIVALIGMLIVWIVYRKI